MQAPRMEFVVCDRVRRREKGPRLFRDINTSTVLRKGDDIADPFIKLGWNQHESHETFSSNINTIRRTSADGLHQTYLNQGPWSDSPNCKVTIFEASENDEICDCLKATTLLVRPISELVLNLVTSQIQCNRQKARFQFLLLSGKVFYATEVNIGDRLSDIFQNMIIHMGVAYHQRVRILFGTEFYDADEIHPLAGAPLFMPWLTESPTKKARVES